jgi:hypothetical protein
MIRNLFFPSKPYCLLPVFWSILNIFLSKFGFLVELFLQDACKSFKFKGLSEDIGRIELNKGLIFDKLILTNKAFRPLMSWLIRKRIKSIDSIIFA